MAWRLGNEHGIRLSKWRKAKVKSFRAWLSRRLLKGHESAITLTRTNGEAFDVNACQCRTCKNVFWVQYVEIEAPSRCPYCGIEFGVIRHVEDPKELEGP